MKRQREIQVLELSAKIMARHGHHNGAAEVLGIADSIRPSKEHNTQLSPKEIRREVCRIIELECGIGINLVRLPNRKKAVKEARHYYAFFLYQYGQLSLKQVGRRINRDHSTVIHSKRALLNLVETEERHRIRFNAVTRKLRNAMNLPTV